MKEPENVSNEMQRLRDTDASVSPSVPAELHASGAFKSEGFSKSNWKPTFEKATIEGEIPKRTGIKPAAKNPPIEKAMPTPWKGPHSSSTGVNAPLPTRQTAGWKGNSQSEAGVAVRQGKMGAAKQYHSQTISEQRTMPKPKLPR
jgi:hypothetical protein